MPYLLALASAAIYGVADFLGGFAARRAPAMTVTFASQAVGLLGLAFLVPVLGGGTPGARDLAWGAGAGIAGGLGVALLYHGLATGVVSVVAPVTAVCAIVIPLAASLALGERPAALALAGVAAAATAVFLLSRSEPATTPAAAAFGTQSRRASASVPIALLSGVCIGAFLVCLGRTGPESGMWPLLIARTVSASGLAIACLALRRPLTPAVGARVPTLGAGVFDVVANALYLVAVRQGSLGLIATLASLYPASTVALAGVVLRERLIGPQKIGLGLALLAIVLITLPGC